MIQISEEHPTNTWDPGFSSLSLTCQWENSNNLISLSLSSLTCTVKMLICSLECFSVFQWNMYNVSHTLSGGKVFGKPWFFSISSCISSKHRFFSDFELAVPGWVDWDVKLEIEGEQRAQLRDLLFDFFFFFGGWIIWIFQDKRKSWLYVSYRWDGPWAISLLPGS